MKHFVILGLLLYASAGGAQTISAGARIRMHSELLGFHRQVATLRSQQGDTLRVRLTVLRDLEEQRNTPDRKVYLGDLDSLEVAVRSGHRGGVKGLIKGFVAGSLVGILAGTLINQGAESESRANGAAVALGFGATGALIGLIVGSAESENWRTVPIRH